MDCNRICNVIKICYKDGNIFFFYFTQYILLDIQLKINTINKNKIFIERLNL